MSQQQAESILAMPRIRPTALAFVLAAFALSACQSGAPEMVQRGDTTHPQLAQTGCWTTDMIPAPGEMVVDEVVLTPARTDERGRVVEPAVTAWRERMADTGVSEERLFAVPCPEQMDTEFVAALQRALLVRGLYAGEVTGVMDSPTRAAIWAWQRPQGLDSDVLSLDGARQLGLVALGRAAF